MVTIKIERRIIGKGASGIASLLPGPNNVKVGFPAGEADADNIQKAIWNEFGTRRGIPERPFMRNSMRSNRAAYRAEMKAAAATIIAQAALGKSVASEKRKALSKLGIKAQGDIQAEITALRTPPKPRSRRRLRK